MGASSSKAKKYFCCCGSYCVETKNDVIHTAKTNEGFHGNDVRVEVDGKINEDRRKDHAQFALDDKINEGFLGDNVQAELDDKINEDHRGDQIKVDNGISGEDFHLNNEEGKDAASIVIAQKKKNVLPSDNGICNHGFQNEDDNYMDTYHQITKESARESRGERKSILIPSIDVFEPVDAIALAAPHYLRKSEEKLVAYLTEQYKDSELLKLRAIWRWITGNIAYDVDSYFNGDIKASDVAPANVLLSGKSVCSGYGNLFKSMCNLAGLRVECISGWAKGYGHVPGSSFDGVGANHAWNAALLDGLWWLFDPTWGAGHTDANKTFVKKYSEYYFMTDPAQFIYKHFPQDPKWQLLEQPITMAKYEKMALYTADFFRSNMKAATHQDMYSIPCNDGNVRLEYQIAENDAVKCIASLFSPDGKELENHIHTYTINDVVHVRVLVPYVGVFKLEVYALSTDDSITDSTFPLVCTYSINSTQKMGRVETFPKQYSDWSPGFVLYRPMKGQLSIGEMYSFKVSVTEDVEKVAIICGSEWTYMENTQEKMWEANAEIVSGTKIVKVSMKYKNCQTSSYATLLEYQAVEQQ